MDKHSTDANARFHLPILALYTLFTVALTWPLTAKIAVSTPGVAQWAFDESTFLWNAWYFKHAFIDQLNSPLQSELIWYPLGIGLILHTYNFFHALIVQPLLVAVNLLIASNLALLFSTVFSAYGTFLLAYYLLARSAISLSHNSQLATRNSQLAAFLAGLLYTFASNRAIYAALGHYDMVTTQWIPFYALMLLRSLDPALPAQRRYKAAALAGLFFAFNGLAEMITALFLALFTLIVLIDVWGNNPAHRAKQNPNSKIQTLKSSLLVLMITGLVAFFVWGPVLVPIVQQFLTEDFSLKGWGEAIPLSTDFFGWFTPTILHPVWGSDLVTELHRVKLRALSDDVAGFRDINTVFLGWTSVGLAMVGAIAYRRKVQIWLWSTLLFGLFTLGPFLQLHGQYQFDLDGVTTSFPMPYALLHYIPIVKSNRAPNRNSVLLMLGIAVLVSYGVAWLLDRIRPRGRETERARERETERLRERETERLRERETERARDRETERPRDQETERLEVLSRSATSLFFASQFPTPLVSWSLGLLASYLAVLLLGGAILFEHLALPAPLSDARIPAVYAKIAADPRPVSVLQVPLGWRDGFGTWGPEQTLFQYYQTAHAKPMLGGNISRAPDFKMDYFKRIPYFQALHNVQTGEPVTSELLTAAKTQAADLLYLYNTGYVLLFPPIPQRFPYVTHWQATWDFVKQTLPLETTPFWRGDGIEAYRVVQPQGEDQFRIDLGTAGTFSYRGEGWDSAEIDQPNGATAIWATAPQSRLFLPLRQVDPTKAYTVRLRLSPYAYPGNAPQTVQLEVNGSLLEAISLTSDWQEVVWQAPGTLLIDGLNRLTLHWAWTAAPRQVNPGSRQIGRTGVALPIDADLKAFDDGGHIALFDEEGQQIDASAGRRGVNVTVLDLQSGVVKTKQGFDTAANMFESEALSTFLQTIQPGDPVLVVSHGDASAFLTAEAVAGLRNLGADVTLDGLRGQFFAIVGVQGVQPGAAIIEVRPDEAFLRVSLDRDRRPLAASVDWVEVARGR